MSSPLSNYFLGVGAKRLSLVEVQPRSSNQHEFNGASSFKQLLGTERITFNAKFVYLSDQEEQTVEDNGKLTWYDAREQHPTRSEYRLYYTSNEVIKTAKASDFVIVAKSSETELMVIIASAGSTTEAQLIWLFGLEEPGGLFEIKDYRADHRDIGYAGRYIISSLGIELEETAPDFREILLGRYGLNMPKTKEFSAFARSTVTDVSPIDEPDTTLIAWLQREELLFRTLEREIVHHKLKEGFGADGSDVDEFITFSLSVQNRRKARAGFAFENNLAVIFESNQIRYTHGGRTERNNKPDFLFPGEQEYHNPVFPTDLLTMLGLKTTAKDRWRQVLSEADRIPRKHLITLEPAISKNQTDEMTAQNLQLIIPAPLFNTYRNDQHPTLITLAEFIGFLRSKQGKSF